MFGLVRSSIEVSDHSRVYMALCEGDDHWTDSRKLHRQVNILRRQPNVNLVHHTVNVAVEPSGDAAYGKLLPSYLTDFKPPGDWHKTGYFSESHNVMTRSAMARFSGISFVEMKARPPGLLGDWILFSILSEDNPPKLMKKKMATYRIHSNSGHSSLSQAERNSRGEKTRGYLKTLRQHN